MFIQSEQYLTVRVPGKEDSWVGGRIDFIFTFTIIPQLIVWYL